MVQGVLALNQYTDHVGAKRAPNFSQEQRAEVVWPIFMAYQRAKAEGRRYDLCDLLAHVYRQLREGGYDGVPIHSIYRDEV